MPTGRARAGASNGRGRDEIPRQRSAPRARRPAAPRTATVALPRARAGRRLGGAWRARVLALRTRAEVALRASSRWLETNLRDVPLFASGAAAAAGFVVATIVGPIAFAGAMGVAMFRFLRRDASPAR